jgi:hypothetical protein
MRENGFPRLARAPKWLTSPLVIAVILAGLATVETTLGSPIRAYALASGTTFVADIGSSHGGADSVIQYAPAANGNVTPVATITGGLTGLRQPQHLALDDAASPQG